MGWVAAESGAGFGSLLRHSLELGAVTVVPGCQSEGEGSASSLGGEVDFGGGAAWEGPRYSPV